MDVSFLSFGLALFAFVCSQIQPLMNYFRRQKVRIYIPDTLTLYNYLGKPSIDLFLSVQNNGSKSISIEKIELILKCDEVFYKIPSRTYYAINQIDPLILGVILLKPDEQWSGTVRFYLLLNDEEEELISEIYNEYESKKRKDPDLFPEINEDIVKKAKRFFKKNFILKSGKYQLFVIATSDTNEIISKQGFKFKLFDKNIQQLKHVTDDYRYGEGLIYGSNDICVPRLIPMTDEETKKEYMKIDSV